ncbi:WD40 repeat-like protein [Dichomitus squalens]|uniref:WD40 repeat-like protein n=1 Tax=Dichomitus squalens TaxID=114155 RepID=A0A4Q9PXD3_9APHY|nr:WD40 repeat-like protein [Dichomitus squalens]TBU59219.1 WD40 repeat-like protein [Dichomitus squalens]
MALDLLPSGSLPFLRDIGATDFISRSAPIHARRRAAETILCDGLPYSKKLVGHTSCVNSLAFSNDGRWLASAGDDPYVQIWDFHQEQLSKPALSFLGPRSNVFTLAFSASARFVYSGDTSNILHQYDISSLHDPVARVEAGSQAGSPSWSNAQHDDSIRSISCHPEQDNLFLSAAEDGRIVLHDMRGDSRYTRTQRILQHRTELTCVQYHPTMPDLFATSDNHGQVCLRDVRMAFGPLSQRRDEGVVHKVRLPRSCMRRAGHLIVQQYVTTVAKQGVANKARPEASSITFDREGRRLAVTTLHHLPTLYALNDPYPIALFSGRRYPNGAVVNPSENTYTNSCTIKHGSFGTLGSDRDMYYTAGSDDFRAYVWKIPEEAALLESRNVVEYSDWTENRRPGELGYSATALGPRYVPQEISTPLARLTGHDSIVNTALCHPHHPYILTAGIERFIRLHSPTEASPCTEPMLPTPKTVRTVSFSNPSSRELFLRAVGMVDDPDVEEDDDDSQSIALFDQILRMEGNGDVFTVRRRDGHRDGGDSSDEDMDGGSDSDAEMSLYQ